MLNKDSSPFLVNSTKSPLAAINNLNKCIYLVYLINRQNTLSTKQRFSGDKLLSIEQREGDSKVRFKS